MNKQQLANKIWKIANKLRKSVEANEYKDYVLGLIFYKFLSDNEVNYLKNAAHWEDDDIKLLVENKDDADAVSMMEFCKKNVGYFIEYKNLFSTWLLPDSTFSVDDLNIALSAFNRNISTDSDIKKVYEGILDVFQNGLSKLGDSPANRTKALKDLIKEVKNIPTDGSQDYDVLGYVYEYLISNFAANAGKKAGEFYTPHEVAILMSEIVAEHHKGKNEIVIYDPTSGSGSLLITIGKSISRHIADKNSVKYYAQELKDNTYNLTRMNLVMRGILPSNIKTRCADSLEQDWPIYEAGSDIGQPLYVDAVVSNPPYSQSWNPKDAEMDARFREYGVAPKSKADYAFLLHELHHLKPDGILAIVLPHGVLFRGSANDESEGKIRKNLIEKNNIDAIIGLPANIFFGTSIPTIVMVLKQNRDNSDVLIIDASKGFVKEGKQNRLRACDIKKIADTVRDRATIPGFSRTVSREEIRDNDYNLNIPRYVDSSDKPEQFDIYATMFGGIPMSEVDALQEYWSAFPTLRDALFEKEADKPYCRLKCANIKEAIYANGDVQSFVNAFNAAFDGFVESLRTRLITNYADVQEMKEQYAIAEDIFKRMASLPLLDKYAAYEALATRWGMIVSDIETLQSEGMDAARVVEDSYKIVKKDDEELEVVDGLKGRVIPFDLVQSVYFKKELGTLNGYVNEQEQNDSALQTLLESLDTDEQEQLLNDDNTKFDSKRVKEAWSQILADISTDETNILDGYLAISKKKEKDEYVQTHPCESWGLMECGKTGVYTAAVIKKRIEELKALYEFEKDSYESKVQSIITSLQKVSCYKKLIAEASQELEDLAKEKIETLSIIEINKLLNLKWVRPITEGINELPDVVIRNLANAITALGKKYSVTYNDIEKDIIDAETALSALAKELTGDEWILKGLNELLNTKEA